MTNNKQSSVEWYIEKILDLDYEYAKGLITLGVWSERKNALIEQAKEMHKKEIITAYSTGLPIEDGVFTAIDKAHKYHNETFNND